MRIVSLFTKYKILGELNKYSLILIYIGFVTLLLLTFSFFDLSYFIFYAIFLLISSYFAYFVISKKIRAKNYDFDGMFPLKEKDYLLVEFSSIYCAGCLVTPTICLLNKNGELITKRIAHLNPEITLNNVERVLRDPIS